MLEEVSGDLEHTCLSHHTAVCRSMHEECSSVEMEMSIVNAAEEQMKVIRKRSEETSVTSFWRQEREDAPISRIHMRSIYQLH